MAEKRTPIERFIAKIQVNEQTGCWEWTGPRFRLGYAAFNVDLKTVSAHRWAYRQFVGPIPEGLELDHLCRVRHCCNPWHCEPVTHAENMRRGIAWNSLKTHCPQGHEYDFKNTYVAKSGRRVCRACQRVHQRAYQERKAAR